MTVLLLPKLDEPDPSSSSQEIGMLCRIPGRRWIMALSTTPVPPKAPSSLKRLVLEILFYGK
jgi:hypothetical protein